MLYKVNLTYARKASTRSATNCDTFCRISIPRDMRSGNTSPSCTAKKRSRIISMNVILMEMAHSHRGIRRSRIQYPESPRVCRWAGPAPGRRGSSPSYWAPQGCEHGELQSKQSLIVPTYCGNSWSARGFWCALCRKKRFCGIFGALSAAASAMCEQPCRKRKKVVNGDFPGWAVTSVR